MKSKNRVTPFLVIIWLILIIVLIAIILIKMTNKNLANYKNLKTTDDLVMELYDNFDDYDIKLFSNKKYSIDSLPSAYIFKKATRFLTTEDVEFKDNSSFVLDYDAVDSGVRTAFGPDFKYDLKDIDEKVTTEFEINDKKLVFDVSYDSSSNTYVGTYSEDSSFSSIKLSKKLLTAYKKSDIIYLKIGYKFYREVDGKFVLCNNSECARDEEIMSSFDDYDYKQTVLIALKKGSDEVYYYHSNS